MKNVCVSKALALVAACSLPIAMVSAVQVRDKVGGDGLFIIGTKSSPVMTFSAGTLESTQMGAFQFEADYGLGFIDLETFCSDPFKTIGFAINPTDNVGKAYSLVDLGTGGYSAPKAVLIKRLWANAYADAKTSTAKAAAFQCLIWEIKLDASIDFAGGNVMIANSGFSGSVRSQAQTWATSLTNGDWTTSTNLYVLTAPDSQDVFTPVPEPGTFAVVGVGIAALLRRRRK